LFIGKDKENGNNDVFNYYLSQLRIRIEMAFGLLCGKWRILQAPLQAKLENAPRIILCCVILHNFVVDERLRKNGKLPEFRVLQNDKDEYYDDFLPSNNGITALPGFSYVRNMLVNKLAAFGFARPSHNIERNTTIQNDMNGTK
jgi:hypothetical protein